jgi:preprotein translocase subunit YajC
MSALPAVVMLQADPAAPDFTFLLMLGSIGLIFYFLVFRPQNQKQKELESSISAAQKGDEVITSGGLHGKVHTAGEGVLTIEIGKVKGGPVLVEIERSRIERVVSGGAVKQAAKDASDKASKKPGDKGNKGGKDRESDES